ncbi:MAG: hypothetical protein QXQ91_04050 [Nanopusillaceae archaeon]
MAPGPGDAVEFLKTLWGSYKSDNAQCFTVVDIGVRPYYRHFCRGDDIFNAVREHVTALINTGVNVYYQVLPLAHKPQRGRGGAADVKTGMWLWADLDYKDRVESAPWDGCREYDDHALECYYVEGDKIIHVKRPSLGEVLAYVRDKVGDPTIVVDSGAGYHLYFKLTHEVDAETLRKLEEWVVDTLGADSKSKDLARILRLPGSVNPRVNRRVKVIYTSDAVYDPDELLQRVVKPRPQQRQDGGLRELQEGEILRIVELLREAYVPGRRQALCLYLSGWLAKANISPVSAARIIKTLYESTGDTDPLAQRVSTIAYSYRKAGINIMPYLDKIVEITGTRIYGAGEPLDAEIKGKSGLQEILEETLGEEKAINIITELTEILQTPSPFHGDFVIELIDFEKRIYAIADAKRKVIVFARRMKKNNKLKYQKKVAIVVPTHVVVYDSPIGGVRKYEITFVSNVLQKPLTIGPALLDEIADRLIAEGLVYKRRSIHDALSAVVGGFILRGRAEIRTTIESRGFYHIDDKIVAVGFDTSMPPVDELREALKLLNEIALVWYRQSIDKFATVVKWGATAPFSFARKQRGGWQPWLYLFGDAATGKTTLGRIVLKMWGLDSRHEKSGANIDTVPRLGYVVSESTFPTLVNEPGGALMKDDVVESIKAAIDGRVVRGKYHRGTYVEYPALAPLILTSNRPPPQDDALLRRFKIISFSFGEKIPPERQEEFKRTVEPRLDALSAVGRCIAHHVVNKPALLHASGDELLSLCYDAAGLDRPGWLDYEYTYVEDIVANTIENFVERLKKYVNDMYVRYVGRIAADTPNLFGRFKHLAANDLIPGVEIRLNNVAITKRLLDELGLDIPLKSLAEMMKWEYKPWKKRDGSTTKAAVAPLERIEELLVSEEAHNYTTQNNYNEHYDDYSYDHLRR